MTKKEFERWVRLCQERHNREVRGWLCINVDCPALLPNEKGRKYFSLDFKSNGSDLIKGRYFIVSDKRQIHHKWVKSIKFNDVWNWKDTSGKRESKLNWVLKNLQDVSQS